jgi:serine/threonine protein kinase/ABC-type branched-subunit amino acid transport system substrate-binding protein
MRARHPQIRHLEHTRSIGVVAQRPDLAAAQPERRKLAERDAQTSGVESRALEDEEQIALDPAAPRAAFRRLSLGRLIPHPRQVYVVCRSPMTGGARIIAGAMSDAAADDPLGLFGTLLERKYRVDRRVAEGGFGVVYAGFHIGLAMPLAIKVLKRAPQTTADEWSEMVARFLEEGRIVAQLRHPAVVRVMDVGVTPTAQHPAGIPWIAMEWIDGETLTHELARRRARGDRGRSRAEAFTLLRPVLEAIAEAHDAGIAHRDLNPNNLMLISQGRAVVARVLDFGIAKVMAAEPLAPSGHTTTEAAVRAFSTPYAAPEQLSGMRTGPWTDVHALGLVLAEVLCGRRRIEDDDVDAHYRAAFDPTRPTPATLGVDVGDWEPILARALALSPRDRYASAGALLDALDATRTGSSDAAEPSGDPASDVPAARTRVSAAPAGAAAVSATAPTVPADASMVRTTAPAAPASAPTLPVSAPTLPATPPAIRRLGSDASAPATARASGPHARARLTRMAALGAVIAALLAAVWLVLRPHGRAPSPNAAPVCTSNASCSTPGAPAICRPGVGCVALRSRDCEPRADARALESASTVWFGVLFPRTGPDAAAFGDREANAVELARRDFAQIMSGASVDRTLDRARPFGLIVCDDAADYRRAAAHLVTDVGVPAVIGFYSSVEAIELTTSLFLPNRVLAIAALNGNPLVTSVPHPAGTPRLVWRTTYNVAHAAAAASALVGDALEPALRREPGAVGDGALRVAVLRPRDARGAALGDAFSRSLRFNGKTALDNGAAYRELTFDAEAPRTSPEYARLRDELLAFAPHVILYAANAAIVEALFAPLEDRWPRDAPYRPRYASVGLIPKELLAFVGTSQDRRRRFFGVTSVGSTAANARLVTHYNETFPDPITRTIDPNSSYDAFYLLAYATYAIPRGEPITGERLARAIAKLVPPGRPIEVGLTGIFDAYTALRNDESIDLTGATGRLDFDLKTGEAAFDLAILCIGVDDHGAASDGIESGLVYAAATNQLAGTMRCP